ncbi:phospholipase D-like domain-containing protein [Demequina muriae]|uniref:Phospholipase D-like domain-containing protein n=1 Tax=Demequina muriae TaxID=3051664 RepID=A0ABT8GHE6_9MICO|nr:phospholipase D-like domain-containing protein [Demequina sp. EGI L300058]MDN4480789.1 phospholipase D-like domain-containing protein [Demequina sp. EGI L300058]
MTSVMPSPSPDLGRVHADAPPRGLPSPTLMLPGAYIHDATARVHAAQRRVRLTTLTIADEQRTYALIEALVDAARRGVDVQVAADVFTYIDAAGTFLPARYRTTRRRESSALASRLTDAGAKFTWLGSERGLIWRGRTHTKMSVIDDVSYAFGGVNIDDRGARNADYMFRVEDPRLADELDEVYERIVRMNASQLGHPSLTLRHGDDAVLVDGGVPGDSVIYRRAMTLASEAVHVLLISQYCPTGPLGRIIAERPHALWFNPPRHASPANRVLISASMAATGYRTQYRSRRYLHAKCLVMTMPSGERVAITGSHNFVRGGVALGTREIALETRSDAVIDQILAFHRTHVVGGRQTGLAHPPAL